MTATTWADAPSPAIWALTPGGAALAADLQACWPHSVLWLSAALGTTARGRERRFDRLRPAVAREFNRYNGHVFIMSAGIVVRLIAPLLDHKTRDPAVVVVGDDGRYAVSLLGGHLGGANRLAQAVAEILGARAVVTTATDLNRLPAIDVIAQRCGLVIENPDAIRTVGMALLQGEPIRLDDPDGWLAGQLAPSLLTDRIDAAACVTVGDGRAAGRHADLILRPPSLVAGIGCNRNTALAEIRDLLDATLERFALSPLSLAGLASVDLKQDEPGLRQLADHLTLPLTVFTREQLAGVSAVARPSAVVARHIGVPSVCEAAAILAAGNGPLIVPKQKSRNVTVAVARRACTSSG